MKMCGFHRYAEQRAEGITLDAVHMRSSCRPHIRSLGRVGSALALTVGVGRGRTVRQSEQDRAGGRFQPGEGLHGGRRGSALRAAVRCYAHRAEARHLHPVVRPYRIPHAPVS
jgi:hypothetical protein